MNAARSPWVVLAAVCLSACGARTGLRAPDPLSDVPAVVDVPVILDVPAVIDRPRAVDVPRDLGVPDVCAPATTNLLAGRAEVMFVLDRSGSMAWPLAGPSTPGPSRWSVLDVALHAVLPRYDASIDMGVLFYPEGLGLPRRCVAPTTPQLSPRMGSAAALLSLVRGTTPGGYTPTAMTLEAAGRFFLGRGDPSRPRAVVLATDGAPNCNAALDARLCPCTNSAGLPVASSACSNQGELCLDDLRTLRAVDALAARGIPTYVIGIDGDPDPALARVLTRLAVAGGRPNPLDPARAFFSVRSAPDLPAAFDRIERTITQCDFSLPSPPPSERALAVTLDGVAVPYDPTGRDGWLWTDATRQRLVFNGATCARAREGVHRVALTVLCR